MARRAPKRVTEQSAARISSKSSGQATVHEAKTHLSRLLNEVEEGATITITRRGKPIAHLVSVAPQRRPVFGSMKGLIAFDESFFDPLPDEELEAWGEY